MTHGSVFGVRGGSWNYLQTWTRAKDRNRFMQGQRFDFLGVRLVRVSNPFQQIAESTALHRVDADDRFMEE